MTTATKKEGKKKSLFCLSLKQYSNRTATKNEVNNIHTKMKHTSAI